VKFRSGLALSVEAASLRQWVEREPEVSSYPLRLARILAFGGRHEDALAVVRLGRQRFPDHPGFVAVEGECANAMGDHARARHVLSGTLDGAGPDLLSWILHERGTAEEALGLIEAAEDSYAQSLALHRRSPRPCKSLHALFRARGDVRRILQSCDALEAHGVRHARMHADRMVATAIDGQKDRALDILAFDRFTHFEDMAAALDTSRWSDLATFNAALEAELVAEPNRQYERRMTASRGSWRIQQPFSGFNRPALHALREMVATVVHRHAATIMPGEHFFSRGGGSELSCSSWAICAPGDGYEDWHVHPGAWLTGVYYVRVPETDESADQRGGCITFGLPDYPGMPDPGDDWHTLRPRPGTLALFPSHCFHRTWSTKSDEQRWIIAFDIMPVDG